MSLLGSEHYLHIIRHDGGGRHEQNLIYNYNNKIIHAAIDQHIFVSTGNSNQVCFIYYAPVLFQFYILYYYSIYYYFDLAFIKIYHSLSNFSTLTPNYLSNTYI